MGVRETGSYGQFCPVAMAAEVLCRRWTPLLVRELLCGSTRFNELRRGLPRMSPTLLATRLRELEAHGIVAHRSAPGGGASYALTPAGAALGPVVLGLGRWGHRWIETSASLANLDPSLLMWDVRRRVRTGALAGPRTIVEFLYRDVPRARRCWWLVIDTDDVDLCYRDPGHEVDLRIATSLRTMTAVWMGYASLAAEIDSGAVHMAGDPALAASAGRWLGLSPFAPDAG